MAGSFFHFANNFSFKSVKSDCVLSFGCPNISIGLSMAPLKTAKNCAARESSTTLASDDKVTVIIFCGLPSESGFNLDVPTAKMHACGGLMTAVNSLIPNIPRLEILKCKSFRF